MTLAIVAALLVMGALPALYIKALVLDTDRYLATIGPLAADPAVQREIADTVTHQITESMDVEQTAQEALAELTRSAPRLAPVVEGLAPIIAVQFESLVHAAAVKFVESPQFNELWNQANWAAHRALVNLATQERHSITNIDDHGVVTISTREIIAHVKEGLAGQGVGLAAGIPDIDANITLFQSPDLVRILRFMTILDRAAPLLAALSAIAALGSIAVAPPVDRRRAIVSLGVALAVATATLVLAVTLVRSAYLNSVPPEALSPEAAQSLVDAVIWPLLTGLRVCFLAGLLVAGGAIFSGPSKAAQLVRRGVVHAKTAVFGKPNKGHTVPWQITLERYGRALQASLLGAAISVLVLWQNPTLAVVAWTVIIATTMILLVNLACRLGNAPGTPDG